MTSKFYTEFDQDAGAIYLRFRKGAVERTIEFTDSIMIDVSKTKRIIGVEFLDTSKFAPFVEEFCPNIAAIEHAITEHVPA